MKVLHILDSLNRGGTEMLVLALRRRASRLGIADRVEFTGFLPDEQATRYYTNARAVYFAPIDEDYGYGAVEALHAYLATRSTDVRQVLSFHLCAADAKNRRALKFLTPRMDANIAVSRDLLDCLRTNAGLDTSRNFHVIYNGVDATRLKIAGGNLRAELGLAQNDLLLGMVGNFYADGRKDQLTVCRALPQLFAAVPAAHFVFVGAPGTDAPQAFDECVRVCREQGIAERVRFIGQRADIPDILRALDLFVFSSRADSFGVAVVEALLSGVPAVVSDIKALREVTADGRYAALFRTGDADDLARQLIELVHDPERRAELGARGRAWALRQFGIAAHIARLRELYSAVAGMP